MAYNDIRINSKSMRTHPHTPQHSYHLVVDNPSCCALPVATRNIFTKMERPSIGHSPQFVYLHCSGEVMLTSIRIGPGQIGWLAP